MGADSVLRDAAICGDEETFRRLVQDGQDANAVVGVLILGAASLDEFDASRAQTSASGRLSILSYLLENQRLSLYSLNASHGSLKGLTPLGMAAYLNRLDFVTTLLEKGDGLVLVDGRDNQTATPIMYAVRDGSTHVSKYLMSRGARVTSVDWHHHSVLFYSTANPQCLWECELNLRVQRAESLLAHGKKRKLKLTLQQDVSEYDSLACMYQRHTAYPLSPSATQSCVHRLVTSITSSDLSAVHSLLFPSQSSQSSSVPVPVLVNLPDENGWSPIHYCVTSPRPSTAILDALYLAGADLVLYTADNSMTPLHALARFGGSGSPLSFRLYTFIVHFVRDLGAPLDALDLRGETCIHVAARYGRCPDILMAFLECDTNGEAAKIRNSDGQTAYEVAKPDFRSIFEQDDSASIRSGSAASLRTIRPSLSSSSLHTDYSSSSFDPSEDEDDDFLKPEEQFPRPISREKEAMRASLTNPSEAQKILDRLEYVFGQLRRSEVRTRESGNALGLLIGKGKEPADLIHVDGLLQQTRQDSNELLGLYRQLIDAELDDLHAAQEVHTALEQLIARLEERAIANEEEERARTPSMSSYRRLSETPSLVASGSSASVSDVADLAALVTPTGSPRASLQALNASKLDGKTQSDNVAGGEVSEEAELDFACALAAGSVTRQRRASALSGIFNLRNRESSSGFPFADSHCPIEEGVNLVSIPPTRVPEVHDVIVHPESEQPSAGRSTSPTKKAKKRESWLDPYVRRANSDILKAHLENLLEIEQMLFGAEDREMEEAPSPGSVSDEADEGWSWREGVDALEDEAEEREARVESDEGGNFLDMFGAEEESGDGQGEERQTFLDLIVPSEWRDDEDEDECDSRRASTVKPTSVQKRCSSERESLSALDILKIAKREMYAVEEALLTACRSVETAQRYINQAERLTGDIFQKMERSIQSARLASTSNNMTRSRSNSRSSESTVILSSMCVCGPVTTPVCAPVVNTESRAFPLPPSSQSYPYLHHARKEDHRPSIESLFSLSSPSLTSLSSSSAFSPSSLSSSSSSPCSSSAKVNAPAALTDDIRWLRHLLVRKIPIWLDATAYDVDKAGTWVGIVQAVLKNVERTRV